MKQLKWIAMVMLVVILAGCGSNAPAEDPTPTVAPTDMPAVPTDAPVTKAPEAGDEDNCYLFVYFTGNGKGQENIFYAVSEDGFHWETLKGGKPVLTSDFGTKGLRDPFILRSANGKKVYLLATDLHIAQSGDWGKAQNTGSKSLMMWEGKDMVYWSGQMERTLAPDTAGCAWAPEAFYNDKTGEYMVFWSSRVSEDNFMKQRVYYTTTTDFMNFSETKVWIDYDSDIIDVTVIKEDDYYYRFFKCAGTNSILMERATDLLGTWESVSSPSVESQPGVEGPAIFELHPEDVKDGNKYVLLLDNFGGEGYYYLVADTLADGEFTKLDKDRYTAPENTARHGTVLRITQKEYDNLIKLLGKTE